MLPLILSCFIVGSVMALTTISPARAVVISASTSAGSASSGADAGLLGAFYKLNSSYVITLAQGASLAASQSNPTATFRAANICFPTCNTISPDSSSLSTFLGASATALAGNSTSITVSFLRLNGFISIATAGTYDLSIFTDDAASLWIGGTKVAGSDGVFASKTITGSASFTDPGLYPILVEHIENQGSAALSMSLNGSSLSSYIFSGSSTSAVTQTTDVPEPASVALLCAGLLSLAAVRYLRPNT